MAQGETFGPPWTILKILKWTTQYFEKQGIEGARFESELLLSHALKLDRIFLYAKFDQPLEAEELASFKLLVKRRAKNEPMAYITGQRGFMTINLKTDARALIPRPDTETLVEAALGHLPDDAHILDVGTGSGAIALSILEQKPGAKATAIDVSQDALELAQENAKTLELEDRVTFLCSDLLSDLESDQTFDAILSNPPYVGESEKEEMTTSVLEYEPHMALFAGDDGLDIIKRLVPQAHQHLNEGGRFMCEIGYAQGPQVSALFVNQGFKDVEVIQDINRKDRVVVGTR